MLDRAVQCAADLWWMQLTKAAAYIPLTPASRLLREDVSCLEFAGNRAEMSCVAGGRARTQRVL